MTSPLLIPDLLGLADRVEALTGPCRETDALIWAATVGGYVEGPSVWYDDRGWVKHAVSLGDGMVRERKRLGDTVGAPGYTASIDAAMALVPEGWWWRAGECSVSSDATVGPDVAHCPKDMLVKFDEGFDVVIEPPTSAALALCVAALRARSATP